MAYAEGTDVPVERSKSEIEMLLARYGAEQFVSGWGPGEARIQFKAHGRVLRFVLPLPDPNDKRFTQHPRYTHQRRTAEAAKRAFDGESRRIWRALALVIKAKLEAVASKIVTFEDEFMAHIVMPDGKTVAEHARPAIEDAYKSGKVKALLSGW